MSVRIPVLCWLLLAQTVWAAEPDSTSPTVDIQLFHPSPGGTNFITVDTGDVNSHLGLSVGLNLNWAHSPLSVRVIREDGSEQDVGAVVKDRLDLNLTAAFGLFDIIELGFSLPMISQSGLESNKLEEADIDLGVPKLSNYFMGDVRIVPKIQVLSLGDGIFSVSLLGTMILATAQNNPAYAGELDTVYAPSIAISTRVFDRLRLAVDAGMLMRKRTEVTPLVVDDDIFYKAGLGIYLGAGFELFGELYGSTPKENPFASKSKGVEKALERPRTPLEGLVAIRMPLGKNFTASLGGGGGLMPGVGAASPRVFLSLNFYNGTAAAGDEDQDGVIDSYDQCPGKKEDLDKFEDGDGCPESDNDKDNILDEDDHCANEPEEVDGFKDDDGCPDPDNDEDGVIDNTDSCPVDAEDRDRFKDDDGCPEPDNDEDGVLDAADQCPDEKEDQDKFEDFDGCPEADNDQDGLPDLNDVCPLHAEDKDTFQDDDGCPDDNDNDGILDAQDQCPDKAETYNGIKDQDGCPEELKSKSLVEVTKDKIEIKEKIFFQATSAKILPKSFELLDQVVSVLKSYKHIKKLRIEGHTDSQGNKKENQKLSQRRAQSVRNYLIDKNVDKDRLTAQGLGPDQPIASNKTLEGREQNRRVEFVITEIAPIGPQTAEKVQEIILETPELTAPPSSKNSEEPTMLEVPAPEGAKDLELDLEVGREKVNKAKGKKNKEKTKQKANEPEILLEL